MDPDRVGAHLARVRQRIQLGRIEDAVTSALEVLHRDPASTPAASMLSEIAPERLPKSTIAALQKTFPGPVSADSDHGQVSSVGEHAMMPEIARRAGAESGDPRGFEAGFSASGAQWRSRYLSSLPNKPAAIRVMSACPVFA